MSWWENDSYESEIKKKLKLKLLSMCTINDNYVLFTAKKTNGELVTIKAISLKRFFRNEVLKADVLLELEVHTSENFQFINLVKYLEHHYLKHLLVIIYENFAEKPLSNYFKNIRKRGSHRKTNN